MSGICLKGNLEDSSSFEHLYDAPSTQHTPAFLFNTLPSFGSFRLAEVTNNTDHILDHLRKENFSITHEGKQKAS